MGVGVDHRVEHADAGVQKLRRACRARCRSGTRVAAVGRSARPAASSGGGGSCGFCRVAVAPVPADPRHPAGGSAAKDGEAQPGHQAAFAARAALGEEPVEIGRWSARRSRPGQAEEPRPPPRRCGRYRPARCACRDAAAARDRGCRSRPGCGRAGRRRRCRAGPGFWGRWRCPRSRGRSRGRARPRPAPAPEEKQCMTQVKAPARYSSVRMRAMSASASRAWMISGRPVCARGLDMDAQACCCTAAALGGVVVVEPGLADADEFRMARRARPARRPWPAAPRRRASGGCRRRRRRPSCASAMARTLGSLSQAGADRHHAASPRRRGRGRRRSGSSPAKSGKSRWQWLSTRSGGRRQVVGMCGLTLRRRALPAVSSIFRTISRRSAAGSRLTARPRRARAPRLWCKLGPEPRGGGDRGRAARSARPRPGRPRAAGVPGAPARASRARKRSIRATAAGRTGFGRRRAARRPRPAPARAGRSSRRQRGEQRRRSRRKRRARRGWRADRLADRAAGKRGQRRAVPRSRPRRPPRRSARPGRRAASGARRNSRQRERIVGRRPRRLVADEQEGDAGGRFLEHLQKRVGGGGVQLVGGVDDRRRGGRRRLAER